MGIVEEYDPPCTVDALISLCSGAEFPANDEKPRSRRPEQGALCRFRSDSQSGAEVVRAKGFRLPPKGPLDQPGFDAKRRGVMICSSPPTRRAVCRRPERQKAGPLFSPNGPSSTVRYSK
jgi:hypothetical protein